MTDNQRKMIASLGLNESDAKPNDRKSLSALLDIVSVDRIQSDKLGYDWEIIRVGDLEARKTYIAQDTPIGTADNPIVYAEGVALINNAYYLIPDESGEYVRHVYMDGQFVEF